jgi:hypothetical protein
MTDMKLTAVFEDTDLEIQAATVAGMASVKGRTAIPRLERTGDTDDPAPR